MGVATNYKLTQLELKNAYDATFDNPHGRIVLEHLCDVAGITRFVGSTDPNYLVAEKGKQQIVFSILSILNTDPAVIISQAEKKLTKNYNPYDTD
jgi:hypothetical protein